MDLQLGDVIVWSDSQGRLPLHVGEIVNIGARTDGRIWLTLDSGFEVDAFEHEIERI